MSNGNPMADSDVNPASPVVRKIGTADLRAALASGLADFKAAPTHVIFLCVLYPVVGLVLARLTFGYDVLPLLYPLIAGFTLIGPFAAIGLYELSRRGEQGLDVSWLHAFDVLRSPSIRAIATLGVVMMALFVAWLGAAHYIYGQIFAGWVPATFGEFVGQVFTTAEGWRLIVIGSFVGFLFAVVVLTISVVSLPMLLDRDVSAATAVRTSVRAVFANPGTMAVWGIIVAGSLVIGSLPFFVGLAIVMPVLGHSTWHLYRRAVEPGRDAMIERRQHAPWLGIPTDADSWRRGVAGFFSVRFWWLWAIIAVAIWALFNWTGNGS